MCIGCLHNHDSSDIHRKICCLGWCRCSFCRHNLHVSQSFFEPWRSLTDSCRDCIYLLSGVVNVSLFFLTRRVLPKHSIITRRFTSSPTCESFCESFDASRDNFPALSRSPSSFMAEKKEVYEDEQTFQRAESPDLDEQSSSETHVNTTLERSSTRNSRTPSRLQVPAEDRAATPVSDRIPTPGIEITSPGTFSRVSLDSPYSSDRAGYPAGSDEPTIHAQSPLEVPTDHVPQTIPARSPSRTETLRGNLGL